MFRKTIVTLLLLLALFLFGCSDYNDVNKSIANSPTTMANNLTVHFVDVGQGDCIFVQLPNGQHMLIDAGKNSDGNMVVNYLKQQKVDKIDYLVGTHPHEDHIGGLDDVIENFSIGKVYMPKVTHTTKTYRDVLTAVKKKGLKITPAKAGTDILNLDDLKITILAPVHTEYEELNNYSAVVKLTYQDNSFLFTGDAEELSEKEMLENNANLQAGVLKVGHHGSHSSTSNEFLQAVNPQVAVISVGKDNDYGHPHKETLDLLANGKITIYRTDQMGTIVMESDGKQWHIKTSETSNSGATTETQKPGKYLGSINSDKFHSPDCVHVKDIAPKNIIWFKDIKEAQQAGYQPCGKCNPK